MHVNCPHCQNAIEIVDEAALNDIVCESCGSSFSLVAEPTATFASSSSPRLLGHFELTERLGIGAFGAVWKARDTKLDRIVAVKIPRKDQLSEDDAEKFFREARAAAQVKHPNIVGVHEIGREDDSLYIVSDYVEGLTLGDWLTGQRPTVRLSVELVVKIADALHVAHDAGIVHRDLKPSNIMLDSDNEPHVMDFGLAKREAGEITMTADGQVLGTPAYMSPEQARGDAHTADRRADIYALGVILFELLTGERPFRGNQRMLIHQLLNDEAPSPRVLNSNVQKDIETITLKCLEKDPAQRFQNARELSDELNRFLDGEPIESRPVGAVEHGFRWAKRYPAVALLSASLIIASVAGLSAVTILWLRAERHADQEVIARVAAVEAQDEAEHQQQVAESERSKAEAARDDANAIVDQYFTSVANDTLLNAPGMKGLRIELLSEAREHYETFAKQGADDLKAQAGKARAYFNLGRISEVGENHDEAINYFTQSCEIYKGNPDYREEYSDSLNGLAIVYQRQHRYNDALWTYLEAAHQLEQLAAAAREAEGETTAGMTNEQTDGWLPHQVELKLANVYMNLGLTLTGMKPADFENLTPELRESLKDPSTNELRSAFDLFRDANARREQQLAILQSQLDENPSNLKLQKRHTTLCRDLGKGYFSHALYAPKQTADKAEIGRYFQLGIGYFERTLEGSPNDVESQFVLALCHRAYGESLYKTDYAPARSQFELSKRLLERLVYFNRKVPRYQRELAGLSRSVQNLGIAQYQADRDNLTAPLEDFRSAEVVLVQLEELFPNQHGERLDELRRLIRRFQSYQLHKLRVLFRNEQFMASMKYADDLANQHWENGRILNQIAWMLVTEVPPLERNLQQAMRIADWASSLQEHTNGATLDTIARIHYERGHLELAIASQKKAVEHATDKDRAETLEHLQMYEAAQAELEGVGQPAETSTDANEDATKDTSPAPTP